MISKNSFLTPASDLVQRNLGDEIVVMVKNERLVHTFRDTGKDIWIKIQEGVSADDLLEQMTREFSVDKELAWKELGDFLDDCMKKKLVVCEHR